MKIKEIRAMKKDITKDQAKKALEMARAGASFGKILEIVLLPEEIKSLSSDFKSRAMNILFPAVTEVRREYLRARKDPRRMQRAYDRWQAGENLTAVLKEMKICTETFRRWRHDQKLNIQDYTPQDKYIRDKFRFWSHKIKKRKCLKCGRIFRSDVYHLCPACRKNNAIMYAPEELKVRIE